MVKIDSGSSTGWVSEFSCEPVKFGGAAGHHQQAALVAGRAHLVQEHHLVGEDVRRIAVVVVEIAQFGIQEARRPGRRDHPGGADLCDVLAAPVHLALPLLDPEGLLGAGRHVVDHRVPDGSRVLQHVHVDLTEIRVEDFKIDGRASFMLKATVSPSSTTRPESPMGPSAGARSAMIITSRSPLGPLTVCLTESVVSKNRWKPSPFEGALHVGHREVGQQDHRVLVDVAAQVLRVEVVLVQV